MGNDDDDKIVVFGYYETSVDAYLVKGILEENNIPSFISNEAFHSLYPIFNDASGCGIAIHVFERDMELAQKVVSEQQSEPHIGEQDSMPE